MDIYTLMEELPQNQLMLDEMAQTFAQRMLNVKMVC